MKYINFTIVCIILMVLYHGCGKTTTALVGPQGIAGINGLNAQPCTVVQTDIGATVTCPNGSAYLVNGLTGQTGAQGEQGNQGVAGQTGEQGPMGVSGPQGVAGPTGATGQTGPTGSQGNPGVNGLNGNNGTNGSVVTVVQFCTGQTIYPSSFPEMGLCINNEIYAVYWNGSNAWFAEVVPGEYTSTSSTTPCNFNVSANCVVSH